MNEEIKISKKRKDLTGQKFGRLIVIRPAPDKINKSGTRSTAWYCNCDCGNKDVIVRTSGLTSGDTKSCGCWNNESRKLNCQKFKKYNTYDLSNKYGIGYMTNGNQFYFDLEDYEKIKDYCWSETTKGYVTCASEKILLHRLIMEFPEGYDIDHINHNKKDNRKNNLRICSHQNNARNSMISKNNTSGITGVYWSKISNKWYAYIMVDRKNIHLGVFSNINDAIKVRKDAEDKYFGEFAYKEKIQDV